MNVTPASLVGKVQKHETNPKRHNARGLMNYTSLPGQIPDTSEEKPEETRARNRFWRSLGKKIQKDRRIKVR